MIHQHFNLPKEGGAVRSYYLAQALVNNGIRVEIITASKDRHYIVRAEEGMNIHYLPVDYDNSFGFWRRGSSFLKFAWRSARLAARIQDVELCYAISAPLTTGITAIWLKRSRKLPYIFEVGDLWPDAPIALGFISNPILKRVLMKLEQRIYRESKAVVALSSPIRAAIERRVSNKRIHVIPNMADTEFFGAPEPGDEFRDEHNLRGKFIVSYIGAVGFANGLDYLIECARATQLAELPVHFIICGEGAMLGQHKLNVKRLGLGNLSFVNFTNRTGVRRVMDATDAVFVCYKPYKILETGSPNKYFDGLAAGKLILLNFEGWIKEEVEKVKCGVYVDRKDPRSFVHIVRPFVDDRGLLLKYQQSARQLADRYSRKSLGAKFASVLLDESTRE